MSKPNAFRVEGWDPKSGQFWLTIVTSDATTALRHAQREFPNGTVNKVETQGEVDAVAACAASCGQLCLHAEQRAIIAAIAANPARYGYARLSHLELVHVKVVCGELVAGGGPSCWQCSKFVVETQLDAVWLFEDLGPVCNARDDFGTICSSADHSGRGDVTCARWRETGSHPSEAAWRRYTADEFHRATAARGG